MKLGCHVSIANSIDRSVERAKEKKCNTFQIFTRNPRMWKHREITLKESTSFKSKIVETGIWPIFSHMPYLPNLSSSNEDNYYRSIASLRVELNRCKLLEIPYIVTHLGSHLGKGPKKGITQIVNAIITAVTGLKNYPTILLENTSGKTNEVGSSFKEISEIMDKVSLDKIGVCLDTCHAFTRGYDISTKNGLENVLEEIESEIGFDKILLVHLNDSKGELGSRMDKHEHIGLGYIGENGFKTFLNSAFINKPLILETPVDGLRNDLDNLKKVRELAEVLGCK
jgi:deoxyribonuclease-4